MALLALIVRLLLTLSSSVNKAHGAVQIMAKALFHLVPLVCALETNSQSPHNEVELTVTIATNCVKTYAIEFLCDAT